jgi:TrmH family RNA methyltransferase
MITSRANPKLKDMRRLRRSKGDRALVEGPHLVLEAAAAGLALETVLATPAFLAGAAGRRLAAALAEPPEEVAEELLDDLADADSPRGVVAAVRLPRGGADTLPRRPGGLYLYVDGLQDPGNLGALARVAEAAGAAGLAIAPGGVHPNHPRALRASAGSLLRLPAAVGVEPGDLDRRLGPAAGDAGSAPRWVVLQTRGGTELWRAPLDPPPGGLVIATGAEGPGLSPRVAARADLAVTIPVRPPVESLTAVVATALVLYEVERRRLGRRPAGV